ncbi:MAG: hypothetical protein ABSC38_00280 [Verrucomicrobiia bacterium]
MESRIPLPTDNIYKFYAFFGLLLFVFSTGSYIYIVHSTNELVLQTVVEIESIKQVANPLPADAAKKLVLEKRRELAVSDRKFFEIALVVIIVGSVFLMIYGFGKWHKEVQPIQDEMAQLQLKKLRHEVNQLTGKQPSSTKTPLT